MPFGSVVTVSNSVTSRSSATAVANPLLLLHIADRVMDDGACEIARDSGRTVRGRNISQVVCVGFNGIHDDRWCRQNFGMTKRVGAAGSK